MDRLSGDFNRGYTKAIQDIAEVFDYIQMDLGAHRKTLNTKTVKQLMAVILANRENLRENKNGFIRWNSTKSNFEWYEGKE